MEVDFAEFNLDPAAPWFVPVFFSSVHAASLTVAVVQVACVSDFDVIVRCCEVSVAMAAVVPSSVMRET